MGSNRRMDHMTWPEFKEAKTRPVIVPIGSTEQHGQHLPIGTDAVLATRAVSYTHLDVYKRQALSSLVRWKK